MPDHQEECREIRAIAVIGEEDEYQFEPDFIERLIIDERERRLERSIFHGCGAPYWSSTEVLGELTRTYAQNPQLFLTITRHAAYMGGDVTNAAWQLAALYDLLDIRTSYVSSEVGGKDYSQTSEDADEYVSRLFGIKFIDGESTEIHDHPAIQQSDL